MKIRTVFQPFEELEVSDEDAEVLRLQGLLHVPSPAAPVAESKPPAATPSAAKSGPAKTDPPAATSVPTDQSPPTEKG